MAYMEEYSSLSRSDKELTKYENVEVSLGDSVAVNIPKLSDEDATQIKETALLMKPWRKGLFL